MNSNIEPEKAIRFTLILNIIYITISYLYALIRKQYNGDFLEYDVRLSELVLTIIWIVSTFPFLFLWKIYKSYKRKSNKIKKVYINIKTIQIFVFFLLISHIFISWFFGVGKALAPIYEAPPLFKLFIQIILRFDPNIWATFLIFVIPKQKYKSIIITILLLILLGIVKAFIGVVYSCLILLVVKYYAEVSFFLKKYLFFCIIGFIIFPTLIEYAYNQRDVLRGVGEGNIKYETNTLIAGKFAGRLSSFSNTAILIDRAAFYYVAAQQYNTFFYVKRMLATIDSAKFGKEKSPEQILKEDTPENVSFMLGTIGILIFSLYNSPVTLIINFIAIILICFSVFTIIRRINFSMNLEFGFLILSGPCVSGVSIEFFNCLLVCIIMFFTLLILRTLHLIFSTNIYKQNAN